MIGNGLCRSPFWPRSGPTHNLLALLWDPASSRRMDAYPVVATGFRADIVYRGCGVEGKAKKSMTRVCHIDGAAAPRPSGLSDT